MKRIFGIFCILLSALFAHYETSYFGNNFFPQTKEEVLCDIVSLSLCVSGAILFWSKAHIKTQILVSTIFMTYCIAGMVMKVSDIQINIVLRMELKPSVGLQSQKFITLSSTKLNTGVFRLAANEPSVYADFISIAQSLRFSRMFLANKICIKHFVNGLFFLKLKFI